MVQGRLFHPRDFKHEALVGTGTFSAVRMVTLKHFEEGEEPPPMVLKTMKKALLLSTCQVEHVKAEKQLMEMLDCPFISNYLSSFQDERRIFLLLEYVHGGELYNRLRREGRLPVDHCKFYAAQLVLALHYLHELKIVYRDIKPENIMIDRMGNVKLIDFGFAKMLKQNALTYTLVGTPEYLAPEIVQSRGHSLPCDFWALGVLIFEMITGYPPFFDKSPFEIYSKILSGKVTFPRHFDVKARTLVKSLLVQEPAERFMALDCMTALWFDYVDWESLQRMERVRAPWKPRIEQPFDTGMFELPEDDKPDSFENAPPITKKDNKFFVDVF